MDKHYDVVIVGAGLAGSVLARRLANTSLRVAAIEAVEPQLKERSHFDMRSLSLSYGSHFILKKLGLWDNLASQVNPIESIHVSDQGHFAKSRFYAQQFDIEAFGYVIPVAALNKTLWQGLEQQENLDIICPASINALKLIEKGYQLKLHTSHGERAVSCHLLVVADGGQSPVRHWLNVAVKEVAYDQFGIIGNIGLSQETKNAAFERFTLSGPLALLPLSERRMAFVWSCDEEQLENLQALDSSSFLQRLQRECGYRLGKFQWVSKRQVFPLTMAQAEQVTVPHAILVGNAAQRLHPVAAQGFNLGLRDVETLACLLESGIGLGQELLDCYQEQRHTDRQRMLKFTHALVRLFSSAYLPIGILRSLGLLGIDFCSPLKRSIAMGGMGMWPHQRI